MSICNERILTGLSGCIHPPYQGLSCGQKKERIEHETWNQRLGRIGKLSLWHHVSRQFFSEIVVNLGRQVGSGLVAAMSSRPLPPACSPANKNADY